MSYSLTRSQTHQHYRDAMQLSQSSESPDFRRRWWRVAGELRAALNEDCRPSDSEPQEIA
jgi:hypothetical protein